jgi:hypothetical protein
MPLGVLDSFTTHLDAYESSLCWHVLHTTVSGREQSFPGLLCPSAHTVSRSTEDANAIELLTIRLNEFVALELSLVPEVEYVFTAFRNNAFYIWVVTELFERETREHIYEREKAIIDQFTMFEFDFYIVSRLGRQVRDLISESVELVFDRYRQR